MTYHSPIRLNADDRLRRLEREAASGDPEALRRLRREQERTHTEPPSIHELRRDWEDLVLRARAVDGSRRPLCMEESHGGMLACFLGRGHLGPHTWAYRRNQIEPVIAHLRRYVARREREARGEVQENPDERIRELERAAATGDMEARVALFRELTRAGQIPEAEVARLVHACDPVALAAAGEECGDREVIAAAGGKKKLTAQDGERIIRAYYRALGYGHDQYGALLSPDGNTRIKFKTTVVEKYSGGRGNWVKVTSGASKIRTAETLLARARGRIEKTGAVAELGKKREKEAVQKKARAKKRVDKNLALRMAVVEIAQKLTSADRAAILLDERAYGRYRSDVFQLAEEARHLSKQCGRFFRSW